jgi:hypothetical protein
MSRQWQHNCPRPRTDGERPSMRRPPSGHEEMQFR